MQLRELLDGEILELHKLDQGMEIKEITCDSRDVKKGALFFAIRGTKYDGSNFITDAIEKGASGVVVEESRNKVIPHVKVTDVRRAFGIASSRLYDTPSRRLLVIGVTGTNGKTTLTYLLESVLREAGMTVGVIGTAGYRFQDRNMPAELTTPDSRRLNLLFSEMLMKGINAVAMEVSSHALELGRVWGIDFDVAVFTNLTQDHLDFHCTMDSYFSAKEKLFTLYLPRSIKKRRIAVINIDDAYGRRLRCGSGIEVISYGREKGADVCLLKRSFRPEGMDMGVRLWGREHEFSINLPGLHNAYNALACISVCSALGVAADKIRNGMQKVVSVPGRLEKVDNNLGIHIFIDYAHTPDALGNAIRAVSEISRGRVITVFGCGGDRDRGKRPLMGRVSGDLSALTVLTSDNPRSESPEDIINEIEDGMSGIRKIVSGEDISGLKKAYTVIPDRREAIRFAIRASRKGDSILIAGKGHEDYQIIGNRRVHFSDREEVESFLKESGAPDRN